MILEAAKLQVKPGRLLGHELQHPYYSPFPVVEYFERIHLE